MNSLVITVVLGLLAGAWARVTVERPQCDSPEVEEAALVAQDYLNAQHKNGYKYVLNRIEDVKIFTRLDGNKTYLLEIDLLETECHVLDPTPVANCTVRPKILTAVEGDCDVVLKTVDGVLAVTAFKCNTDESAEDMCAGCPLLLPLNDTAGLDLVQASLGTVNNMTVNETYIDVVVGRISSQVVFGGSVYLVEYIIVEANCTDGVCVALDDPVAKRGICTAKGLSAEHSVHCKFFSALMPIVDANSTAAEAPALPEIQVYISSSSSSNGLRHHQLTASYNLKQTGLLSAESAESAEVVNATPAAAAADPAADPAADAGSASDSSASAEVPVVVVKRDAPAVVEPTVPVPLCPGRVRFF